MWRTIKSTWCWPGLKRALMEKEKNCTECQIHKDSKTRPTPVIPDSVYNLEPMERVSVDVFHSDGKRFLARVDRFSCFKFCEEIRSESTEDICSVLSKWFAQYGFPKCIRADNAPSFRSTFKKYCDDNEIRLEHSSPYNSESNGHIEISLKQSKKMVKKTKATGRRLQTMMQIENLAKRTDGLVPSDMFHKRALKVPGFPSMKKLIDMKTMREIREKTNRGIANLIGKRFGRSSFKKGDLVRIQNLDNKRWEEKGRVVDNRINDDGTSTSYFVELDDTGKTVLRSAKYIRVRRSWMKRKVDKKVTFALADMDQVSSE